MHQIRQKLRFQQYVGKMGSRPKSKCHLYPLWWKKTPCMLQSVQNGTKTRVPRMNNKQQETRNRSTIAAIKKDLSNHGNLFSDENFFQFSRLMNSKAMNSEFYAYPGEMPTHHHYIGILYVEIDAIRVHVNCETGSILITKIYLAPWTNYLQEEIVELLTGSKPYVIIGDLNAKSANWNSRRTNLRRRRRRFTTKMP